MSVVELHFESRLAAPADAVWRQVSTMRGVNRELMPLLRMTHPAAAQDLEQAADRGAGYLFDSWLLLGGVLPIDRHHLGIERIYRGQGFDERSTSWMQRVWIHRRRVQAIDQGTRITDLLRFEPRVVIFAPLLKLIIATIFRHRHRRLVADFGRHSA